MQHCSTPRLVRSGSMDSVASCAGDTPLEDVVLYLVGRETSINEELMDAIKLKRQRHFVLDESQNLDRSSLPIGPTYVYVLENFDCPEFSLLSSCGFRVVGRPCAVVCLSENKPIPFTRRPLYSLAMKDCQVCFTGFRDRESLSRCCRIVHHLGGRVRKDFGSNITQLVANSVQSESYRLAVSFETTIVSELWIQQAWENRANSSFRASDQDFTCLYKVPPFKGLNLAFWGFTEKEEQSMRDSALNNGGCVSSVDDSSTTHAVVNLSSVQVVPSCINMRKVFVTKEEWFWTCLHIEACVNESLYLFSPDTAPDIAGVRSRKRRWLNDKDLNELLSPESPILKVLRSRKSAEISTTSSLLSVSIDTSPSVSASLPKTARYQTCMELQYTERNYVSILNTIITVFKQPIEQSINDRSGPLMAQKDMEIVFGSIPDLYAIHKSMLARLDVLLSSWSEDNLVGPIILDHSEKMVKAYPAFVNFFELTKETLVRCEQASPRLHAFLKVCQSKPECGRQSLSELLIRPVQRLPSISLLLGDVLKHTPQSNPDRLFLHQAIDRLKFVMTHINEDKRKTEGQLQMFELVRDVEGIPVTVLSAHRSLVTKVDVYELTGSLCERGTLLTLFIFNDSIEIAKKRSSRQTSMVLSKPSPSKPGPKLYRHIEFVPYTNFALILDLQDKEDYEGAFAVILRSPIDSSDVLLMLRLASMDASKTALMDMLAKEVANTKCVTDYESFLKSCDVNDLSLKAKLPDGTLVKALSAVKKTTTRLARALSLRSPRHSASINKSLLGHTPRNASSRSISISSLISQFDGQDNSCLRPPKTPRDNDSSDPSETAAQNVIDL